MLQRINLMLILHLKHSRKPNFLENNALETVLLIQLFLNDSVARVSSMGSDFLIEMSEQKHRVFRCFYIALTQQLVLEKIGLQWLVLAKLIDWMQGIHWANSLFLSGVLTLESCSTAVFVSSSLSSLSSSASESSPHTSPSSSSWKSTDWILSNKYAFFYFAELVEKQKVTSKYLSSCT